MIQARFFKPHMVKQIKLKLDVIVQRTLGGSEGMPPLKNRCSEMLFEGTSEHSYSVHFHLKNLSELNWLI